jgi:hypothetical protein
MDPTNGEPDDVNSQQAATNSASPQQSSGGDTSSRQTTAAVQIKVPPFYRQNTRVWFLQLESQFTLARITSSQTRYHHCLASLPEDVAAMLDLSGEADYDALKQRLLVAFERSKAQKLDEALHSLDVASLRPSVAAQKLRKNFADAGITTSEDLIKHRILRAATPGMQTSMAAHQHQPLNEFLQIADTVFDVCSTLPQTVSKVTEQPNRHRHRSPSPHPSRGIALGLQPFKPNQRQVICRSHIFYGAHAKTCKPWCQWPGPRPCSRSASPVKSENA